MEIQISKANLDDINGVLALQAKYLVTNLSEEAQKNGFVTTPFTPEQLIQVIQEGGLFVAKHNGEIIAYVFAASWDYFKQWDIFKYMITLFPTIAYQNIPITTDNSFQYGPICIDEKYRGVGLINEIFEAMRLVFVEKYPLSITFINQVNGRSLKAHTQKLQWELIGDFDFNQKNYYILAYPMSQSANII